MLVPLPGDHSIDCGAWGVGGHAWAMHAGMEPERACMNPWRRGRWETTGTATGTGEPVAVPVPVGPMHAHVTAAARNGRPQAASYPQAPSA
jgi:hypothetical protein